MEQAELEMLVGELEQRVDRLRSLYDQYFMGIEKIPPGVSHKDVERRIQVLRKEQIRNTGLRFRFQMILQRFNTYQSYWIRICRQIEDGTYKRHMMRAQARFGDEPPRRATARADAAPASARDAPVPPIPSLSQMDLDDLDAEFGFSTRPPMSLEEEFGVLDDPLRRPPSSLPQLAAARASEPQLRVGRTAPSPLPPSGAPVSSSIAPRAGAAGSDSRSRMPIWRKAPPSAPRASNQPPAPLLSSSPGPPSSPLSAPPPVPRPAAPPARVASPPPPPPPQPPPPRVAPAPPPLPARALAPRPAPRDSADLPEERVRQLYAQYVEAKRKRNESTAAITYDGLAKSLRESSAKLRERHGKTVDFEVAVKDGKTVIRPVVK